MPPKRGKQPKEPPVIRAKTATYAAAGAIALLLSLDAGAQNPSAEKVIAKVNGRAITELDLNYAEAEIGNELGSIPADQRRRVLVEYLIENALFAEAGEKENLGTGTAFNDRMKYLQRRALRDSYFERLIKGSISEADAKKLYDAQVAAAKPQEEVRARHILVDSEAKAKELHEKITKGEDFAKLAKANSMDPGSKDEGGDLGYFSRGQMVPQFEETAFKLNKGEVSAPIQSQFGWHIIKLDDKRQRGAPPFDQIKGRIIASMVHRKAQEIGAQLRDNAQVELIDPELKAEADKENQIRPAPAGAAPAPAKK